MRMTRWAVRRCALGGITAATALVSIAPGAAATPASGSARATTPLSVHKPVRVKRHGRVVVFGLRDVDPVRVGGGTLRLRRKHRLLGGQTVRRAVERRGRLRARLPARWLRGAGSTKRARLARKTRLELTPVGTGLRVGLVTNAQGWNMGSGAAIDRTRATGTGWLREEFA